MTKFTIYSLSFILRLKQREIAKYSILYFFRISNAFSNVDSFFFFIFKFKRHSFFIIKNGFYRKMWLWSKNKALPKTVLQVEVFNFIIICWEIQKIAVYWEWNSNNLSKIIEKHFATGKKKHDCGTTKSSSRQQSPLAPAFNDNKWDIINEMNDVICDGSEWTNIEMWSAIAATTTNRPTRKASLNDCRHAWVNVWCANIL